MGACLFASALLQSGALAAYLFYEPPSAAKPSGPLELGLVSIPKNWSAGPGISGGISPEEVFRFAQPPNVDNGELGGWGDEDESASGWGPGDDEGEEDGVGHGGGLGEGDGEDDDGF